MGMKVPQTQSCWSELDQHYHPNSRKVQQSLHSKNHSPTILFCLFPFKGILKLKQINCVHVVTNQHAVTQIIIIFILQASDNKKKKTKVESYIPFTSFIIRKPAMCEDSANRKENTGSDSLKKVSCKPLSTIFKCVINCSSFTNEAKAQVEGLQ